MAEPGNADVLTHAQTLDGGPNRVDPADDLTPRDDRHLRVRQLTIDDMQVRPRRCPPLSLGLAGGPLIGRAHLEPDCKTRAANLVVYVRANLALREIGVVLLLACVGLKADSLFLEVLVSGSSFLLDGGRRLLTFVPLARKVSKRDYPTLC